MQALPRVKAENRDDPCPRIYSPLQTRMIINPEVMLEPHLPTVCRLTPLLYACIATASSEVFMTQALTSKSRKSALILSLDDEAGDTYQDSLVTRCMRAAVSVGLNTSAGC